MTDLYATDPQIKLIRKLIENKDWNSQSNTKAVSRCASIKFAIELSQTRIDNPITKSEEDIAQIATAEAIGERVNQVMAWCLSSNSGGPAYEYLWAPFTKIGASRLIEILLSLPDRQPAANDAPPQAPKSALKQDLEDGIYRDSAGNYVKVYRTRAGHQVGKNAVMEQKQEVANGPQIWSIEWVYEGKAAIRHLTPSMKLTLEEAREFGIVYGRCVCCGRQLTDELSIALGIGPVCGDREFGSDGFKQIVKNLKAELDRKAG